MFGRRGYAFRVVIALLIFVTGSRANSLYANSSIPTTTQLTTTSTTSAETCAGTVNFQQLFLAQIGPLPPEEVYVILLVRITYFQEALRVARSVEAIPPQSRNNALYSSFSSSAVSEFEAAATSLFGTAGKAILQFQSLGYDACLFQTCTNQYLTESASFVSAHPSSAFVFRAKSPCCGQCTVFGNAVDISYWPTPAPTPLTTILVDQNNSTIVSPSVYAAFTGVSAADLCGQVGPTFEYTRYAVDPLALSTSNFPVNPGLDTALAAPLNPLGVFSAINYADFDSPKCLCTSDCKFDPFTNKTITNLCTPQLSIPGFLTSLAPEWASCAPDFGGAFDPPVALPRAEGLTTPKPNTATTTPPIPDTPPTGTTPAPVNNPPPPIASPTSPPGPVDEPPPDQTPPEQPPEQPPVPSASPEPENPPPGVSPEPANPSPPPEPLPSITEIPAIIPPPPSPTPETIVLTAAPIITLNDNTLTLSSSQVIVGSETLIIGGPAVTISGTVISIAPSDVGTPPSVSGDSGSPDNTDLGSIIMSVFSGNGGGGGGDVETSKTATGTATGTSSAGPLEFTGAGSKQLEIMRLGVFGTVIVTVLVGLLA